MARVSHIASLQDNMAEGGVLVHTWPPHRALLLLLLLLECRPRGNVPEMLLLLHALQRYASLQQARGSCQGYAKEFAVAVCKVDLLLGHCRRFLSIGFAILEFWTVAAECHRNLLEMQS